MINIININWYNSNNNIPSGVTHVRLQWFNSKNNRKFCNIYILLRNKLLGTGYCWLNILLAHLPRVGEKKQQQTTHLYRCLLNSKSPLQFHAIS